MGPQLLNIAVAVGLVAFGGWFFLKDTLTFRHLTNHLAQINEELNVRADAQIDRQDRGPIETPPAASITLSRNEVTLSDVDLQLGTELGLSRGDLLLIRSAFGKDLDPDSLRRIAMILKEHERAGSTTDS